MRYHTLYHIFKIFNQNILIYIYISKIYNLTEDNFKGQGQRKEYRTARIKYEIPIKYPQNCLTLCFQGVSCFIQFLNNLIPVVYSSLNI